MRLLYVVHQFLPRHLTGTEQYVRSLARGMQERGHDVTVFAFEPLLPLDSPGKTWIERDEEVDGIPVRRVGIHLDLQPNPWLVDYHDPLAVRFLRRLCDERPFDLAHVFHLRHLGVGALAELRAVGVPVVVNLMDFWFLCPKFTLLRNDGALCEGPPQHGIGCIPCVDPLLGEAIAGLRLLPALAAIGPRAPRPSDPAGTPARRARALVGRKEVLLDGLRLADAVVAPSRFLREKFAANGFPAALVRHVPYGVDPGRFGGRRKEWPAAPRPPLAIGYVGSITEHKGLHVLIAAVRALPGDGWRLDVHGVLDTHPEYTARVLALAAGDPRITFHGPFAPADLGSVLAPLDLIAVPSLWYENTPFTVLEARAMGLPVVASDLGGIAEAVRDGVDGLLFAAGDEAALTATLQRVLDDPVQLAAMGRDRDVRSLADNLDDFERLYAELRGL